jgi:hypothetical protein
LKYISETGEGWSVLYVGWQNLRMAGMVNQKGEAEQKSTEKEIPSKKVVNMLFRILLEIRNFKPNIFI